MNFDEIIGQCSAVGIRERRCVRDGFCELVIDNGHVEEWRRICDSVFGKPVKPAGMAPSRELERIANHYGGIRANQTFYCREDSTERPVAMFWPWKTDPCTTVRMGKALLDTGGEVALDTTTNHDDGSDYFTRFIQERRHRTLNEVSELAVANGVRIDELHAVIDQLQAAVAALTSELAAINRPHRP